jgi:hypothetical protein
VAGDNTVQRYVGVHADDDPQVILEKLRRVVEGRKLANKIPVVKCSKNPRGRFYFFLGVKGWKDVYLPEEVRRVLELLGLEAFAYWPMEINYILWKLRGEEIETHYFKSVETAAPAAGVVPPGTGYTSVGAGHPVDPFDLSESELPDGVTEDSEADQRFDRLLYWLSARAEGSWEVFVQACQLLRLVQEPRHARHVQRRLMLLGHVECSADGGRWSICPAAVVRSQSGESFLCGQRTPELLEELSEHFGIVDRPQPGHSCPTRLMINGLSLSEGESTPLRAGVALTAAGSSSDKLARVLPDLAGWQDTLTRIEKLNPYNYEIERWAGGRFSPCQEIGERHNVYSGESGMYRLTHKVTGVGMTLYFDQPGQRWLRGDWYGLRYLAHQTAGTRCGVEHDTRTNELRMPIEQHWPLLYERALVLSSGFLPHKIKGSGALIYQGVPAALSRVLAEKLNVSVEEKHHA